MNKRRIVMIADHPVSADGLTVEQFREGEERTLPADVAKRLVEVHRVAEWVGEGDGTNAPEAVTGEAGAGDSSRMESPEDGAPERETPSAPAPVAPEAPTPAKEAPAAPVIEAPERSITPTDEEVEAAIRQLDPDDPALWTADDKPDARALTGICRGIVKAPQRDRVWERMSADG